MNLFVQAAAAVIMAFALTLAGACAVALWQGRGGTLDPLTVRLTWGTLALYLAGAIGCALLISDPSSDYLFLFVGATIVARKMLWAWGRRSVRPQE